MSDFSEKSTLFNDFFATQCTPLSNISVLPSAVFFKTQSRLSSINFEKEDIFKIIRNLNIDEAHGHGNISMQIFTTCDSVLLCHLYIKIV